MKNKIFILVVSVFVTLNGCSVGIQENITPTSTTSSAPYLTITAPPTEVISPVPNSTSTKTLPQGETSTLTVSTVDIANNYHVYKLIIGCLETTPCGLSSKELFNMPSTVGDLNWSPDGKLLAFSGIEGDSFDIFNASNDGKTITNITNSQDLNERSPNWSPDGTQIAYSVTSRMEASKILKSSPDGKNTKQILNDVFEPIQFTWSSDGKMAYSAFVSTHDGRYQIRVLNKDGSLYWQTPLDESKMGFGTANATFSPDGKWLLYTGGWLNNDRIYLADLQTKTIQELFPNDKTCSELNPSWSPDGKWFAFISNCDSQDSNQYQLYLVNLANRQKIKVDTGIDGSIYDATWRPNNK